MSDFLQIIFSSLESGSIYALAALGIILIFKTSSVTNFAQGTLGMFNAYVATKFAMETGVHPVISALFGMAIALIIGIVIDIFIMRPAKKSSPVSKQILTFGIIMLFLGVTPSIFGTTPLQYGRFIKSGSFDLAGSTLTYNALLNIVIGFVIMIAIFVFLKYTKWGLGVRATASRDNTARMMGIPTEYINMGSWAVAAALSTLAALMVAPTTQVTVAMLDSVQIFALIACVLGGFQTFHGPLIGAYVIAFSKNLLAFYVSSTWSLPLTYLFVLLVILLLPNGLFSKKIVKKV